MFDYAFTFEGVGRTIGWTAIVAIVGGYFWSCGCSLWARCCCWRKPA